MTNFFKHIKQIFIDNKEYFIKCTLMSIIAALILGLSIGLSVSVSAEASGTIIEAGTYRFNDELSSYDGADNSTPIKIPINFFVSPNWSVDFSSNLVTLDNSSFFSFESIFIYQTALGYGNLNDEEPLVVYYDGSSIPWNRASELLSIAGITNSSILNGWGQTITIPVDTDVDYTFSTWFESNTEPIEATTATITSGTYFGVDFPSSGSFNVSFSFTSDSYDFDTFYVGTDYITYRMLTGSIRTVNAFDFTSDLWAFGFESITVSTDQTLPADFVTWFNSNYSKQNTPDPGPTYTIEAGYYKARDSFSVSGWNVTNDSIRIRYYNDAINVQSYEIVDGISFRVQNDMAEIYYADNGVFTDGWNIDGAKNIQVLQDITVSSDFYTVFNSVYAPSSESSNEFDSGYAAGYVDGRDEGYDIGYRQGYAEGFSDGDTNIFTNIIGGTLAAVDSFTIFGGFSLLDLISTLLGGMALVWILKLLAGG